MAGPSSSDDARAWNKIVGDNVRVERRKQGITQEGLAGVLGLSYGQVFKYENGSSRVSAGRLYEIAKILKIPID